MMKVRESMCSKFLKKSCMGFFSFFVMLMIGCGGKNESGGDDSGDQLGLVEQGDYNPSLEVSTGASEQAGSGSPAAGTKAEENKVSFEGKNLDNKQARIPKINTLLEEAALDEDGGSMFQCVEITNDPDKCREVFAEATGDDVVVTMNEKGEPVLQYKDSNGEEVSVTQHEDGTWTSMLVPMAASALLGMAAARFMGGNREQVANDKNSNNDNQKTKMHYAKGQTKEQTVKGKTEPTPAKRTTVASLDQKSHPLPSNVRRGLQSGKKSSSKGKSRTGGRKR